MANEHLLNSNNPFVVEAVERANRIQKQAEEQAKAQANPKPPNLMLRKALDAIKDGKTLVVPCGPDREPLTPNGWADATDDFLTVRTLWTLWPDAVVGLVDKDQDQ